MIGSINSNLVNVAGRYIETLKISIPRSRIKERLEQNSFYPSMFSLASVYKWFGISNKCVKISNEKFDLLAPPFITFLNLKNAPSDFVLVTSVSNDSVTYFSGKTKEVTDSKQDFLKGWNNVIFVADNNIQIDKQEFLADFKNEKRERIKRGLLSSAVAVTLILVLRKSMGAIDISSVIILIPAIIFLFGLTVSIFLLLYAVDNANTFIKSICVAGKETNCDLVLNSRGASLLGISLSEAGYIYFAFCIIFLFFPGLPIAEKLPVLAVCSYSAVPLMIYCIFYQWRVVKKWCILCLAIHFLLSAQLCWALGYYSSIFSFGRFRVSPDFLTAVSMSLLMPVSIWYLLKPLLVSHRESRENRLAYKRLLYNPEIFESYLNGQKPAYEGWEKTGIKLGNSESLTKILMVCNPYCGHCGRAHFTINEMINRGRDIELVIIFLTNTKSTSRNLETVKYFLAIAASYPREQLLTAIHYWYAMETKSLNDLKEKFPVPPDHIDEQNAKMELMKRWCIDAAIKHTPTTFINGKLLPENYNINELKNIL